MDTGKKQETAEGKRPMTEAESSEAENVTPQGVVKMKPQARRPGLPGITLREPAARAATIREDEEAVADDELVVVDFEAAKTKMKPHQLTVGRYITTQVYSARGLFEHLKQVWHLRGAIEEKAFANNRYLIQFKREGDYNHVLKGGPWTYKNYPMLVMAYDGQTSVANTPLNMMPTWVRILDLPISLMNEEWAREVTNKQLGDFKAVAKDNKGRIWGEFLRIRMEHDVTKPIRRWVKVQNGKTKELLRYDVKYERLPNFCFYCGIVGHVERGCMLPEEEKIVRYCVEQRASSFKSSDHRSYYIHAEPAMVKRHLQFYSTPSSGWKLCHSLNQTQTC
jgi:hypothetical protein